MPLTNPKDPLSKETGIEIIKELKVYLRKPQSMVEESIPDGNLI